MTRVVHRAEGLPDTTALGTGNSAGSAGSAYSGVVGTVTASTTHAAHGTRSIKCVCSAASTATGQDSSALGTLTVVRGRAYLWIDGAPPANVRVGQTANGGSLACGVGMSTARFLRLVDSASAQMAIGTSAIPTGQWVRIEWRMVASATVGQASAKVWFSAESTGTPDETLSSAASFNTKAGFDRYDSGLSFTASQTYTAYVDEVVWDSDDSAEIGPYADPYLVTADFEGGSPLAPFDSTSGTSVGVAPALVNTAGVRLDSRAAAAYLRIGPTLTGPGRRWATIRFWGRLPLGVLSENLPLLRFRNTDALGSGGGGNGDVWVDHTDGSVRGDLQPADSFTGAAGLIVADRWFLVQAVCSFKDDGTSSMKVKINGTQIGTITSTVPTAGEAHDHIDIGAAAVVDGVLDVDQLTAQLSDSTLDYIGAGASFVTLGQAVQTDTALAVATRQKQRTLSLATETDTALPATRLKSRTLGLAVETDTALPVTRRKQRTLSQATETDTALALTLSGGAPTTATPAPIGVNGTTPVFHPAAAGDRVVGAGQGVHITVRNTSASAVTLTITPPGVTSYNVAKPVKVITVAAAGEKDVPVHPEYVAADGTVTLAWSATPQVTWAAKAL